VPAGWYRQGNREPDRKAGNSKSPSKRSCTVVTAALAQMRMIYHFFKWPDRWRPGSVLPVAPRWIARHLALWQAKPLALNHLARFSHRAALVTKRGSVAVPADDHLAKLHPVAVLHATMTK